MYQVLVNVDKDSKEFAISVRRLESSQHWKLKDGFYFDSSDKNPRPFFVQANANDETDGRKFAAVIEAGYALLSYKRVYVKSK